ncbi:M67 family metallopeptidase [Pyrobaculum aerophilum]|uniref:M67 family metallopeptidase n=1 Tax=Pyrobaculum aerophilum TaxID=13773 RepID=A0A832SZK0_9CREN|nr:MULTISPECIES: M67 family metallopeptidase [Pyrobaculum]MCX8137622.1 M67 family metallopeptidase [Pyrobaculum aerophilum]HII46544.1 M67 family metallopeptidase [Pyrobaculum aerophilum]
MKVPKAFLEEARKKCAPEAECVALIFGISDTALSWRWMKNVAASPVFFKLDPEEVYKAIVEAEERGEELLAIFHTHPGPPTPSWEDVRHMRLWPVTWIIANVFDWHISAWRIDGGLKTIPLEFI